MFCFKIMDQSPLQKDTHFRMRVHIEDPSRPSHSGDSNVLLPDTFHTGANAEKLTSSTWVLGPQLAAQPGSRPRRLGHHLSDPKTMSLSCQFMCHVLNCARRILGPVRGLLAEISRATE